MRRQILEDCVLPVSEADGGVHGKESQKLFIQQSVDAAFPGQK